MGRGRKPKIVASPEIVKEICALIGNGFTNKAAIEGIMDESTFYSYMNKGEEDVKNGKETPHADFYKSVKKAEKGFRLTHLKRIKDASEGNWQASAWMLERRFADEYGRNRLEISGNNGEPIKTENAVQIYLPDNGRS